MVQKIESEPVLAVAVEFFEARKVPTWEGMMDALWKEWRQFAEERGLLHIRGKKFPGGANVLSRKLSELKPVLAELGITVTIERSNGSKVVITGRMDGENEEPSGQPSAQNSLTRKHLSTADDKEARLSILRGRKSLGTAIKEN